MSKWKKRFLALLAFFIILLFVDSRELLAAVSNIDSLEFLYLISISVVLVYISALKWRCFLQALGISTSLLRAFRLYLLGYFINLLAPSFIGGDAVRSMWISSKTDRHEAFAATILERYTGFVAMSILATGSIFFIGDLAFSLLSSVLIVLFLVIALTFVSLSSWSTVLLAKIPTLGKKK